MDDANDTTVRLQLLGQFVVHVGGERLPPGAWRRRRPAELLKLVASSVDRRLRREAVIEALWPDKGGGSGGNNLHRAIYDLRRIVGEGVVRLDHGVVCLGDAVEVDVRAFEEGLAAGESVQVAEALALYAGPLCAEDIDHAWLEARRLSLQGQFEDASLQHGRRLVAVGDEAAAISTLRRLLELNPTREDGHRLLMRALAAGGRPRDALSQYTSCVEMLRRGLDREPELETVRLRDAIEARLVEEAKPDIAPWRRLLRRLAGSANPPRMHGRQTELATITSMVARTLGSDGEQPEGAVLLILGEAGAGKTRLVSEVVRLAGQGGALLLAGSATDMGRGLPFAPFAEAWTEYRHIANRPPEDDPFASFAPAGGQPQEEILRLLLAVERALGSARADAPAVLIVEDLHWADESSLQLFHHLVRVSRSAPLLLVGTCRQDEVDPGTALSTLLTSCRREHHVRRVTLGPLSREATARQVVDLLVGSATDELAASIFALTGGNAFYTEEVALAHAERDEGETLAVPETLAEVVRERVAKLGDDGERFLRAASIVGRTFAFTWAQAASGLSDEAAMAAGDASLGAWLIEQVGDEYRFRHALVQSEIYSGLSRERRLTGHSAVADYLLPRVNAETGSALGAVLAHHLCEAKRPREAMPQLIASGQYAMQRVGFQEARRYFDEALSIMDECGITGGAERLASHHQLGVIHCALSNMPQALEHFERARALLTEGNGESVAEAIELDRLVADALITMGDYEAAEARLDDALGRVGGDAQQRSMLLLSQAQLHWSQERHEEARALAQRVVEVGEQSGDPDTLARGYEMLAMACHSLGQWRQGMDYVQRRQKIVGDAIDVARAFEAHL